MVQSHREDFRTEDRFPEGKLMFKGERRTQGSSRRVSRMCACVGMRMWTIFCQTNACAPAVPHLCSSQCGFQELRDSALSHLLVIGDTFPDFNASCHCLVIVLVTFNLMGFQEPDKDHMKNGHLFPVSD